MQCRRCWSLVTAIWLHWHTLEVNGKIQHIAFRFNGITYVTQIEIRLNVEKRLQVVQKRRSIEIRVEDDFIGGQTAERRRNDDEKMKPTILRYPNDSLPCHYLIKAILTIAFSDLLHWIHQLIFMEINDFSAGGQIRSNAKQFRQVQYARRQDDSILLAFWYGLGEIHSTCARPPVPLFRR